MLKRWRGNGPKCVYHLLQWLVWVIGNLIPKVKMQHTSTGKDLNKVSVTNLDCAVCLTVAKLMVDGEPKGLKFRGLDV